MSSAIDDALTGLALLHTSRCVFLRIRRGHNSLIETLSQPHRRAHEHHLEREKKALDMRGTRCSMVVTAWRPCTPVVGPAGLIVL